MYLSSEQLHTRAHIQKPGPTLPPGVQVFEPVYQQLAKRFAKVGSVVIARMDSSANEHAAINVKVGTQHGLHLSVRRRWLAVAA